MSAKTLVVNFVDLTQRQLDKIKAVATGIEVLAFDDATPKAISECDILFGQLEKEQFDSAKNLKWFHAQSAGVDHYLKMGLPESILLTNSAGMHGISIAEHMLGHTLMLMRRLHSYDRQQAQHKWEHLGKVQSIYKSQITVVGLGGIGSEFAKRCRALGAEVYGVVRSARAGKPDCVDKLFTIDKLDEAIKNADVVALTLPNTDKTAGLFDKEQMLKMKKGAFIINVGRGSAIDQDAMIELLESGHLGGAGLDVTEPEPLPKGSKLWDMPQVVLTPHISGGGTLPLVADMIANRFIEYLTDYIAGRTFKQVVDRKAGY